MKKVFLILCVQQSGPIASKIDAEVLKITSALLADTIELLGHKGVEAIILADAEGVPIRYNSVDEEKAYFYTTNVVNYLKKCKGIVKDLTEEDPTLFRIRTKVNEIMIYPEADFIFIVIQNPASNS